MSFGLLTCSRVFDCEIFICFVFTLDLTDMDYSGNWTRLLASPPANALNYIHYT